jgi:hypothetical protein
MAGPAEGRRGGPLLCRVTRPRYGGLPVRAARHGVAPLGRGRMTAGQAARTECAWVAPLDEPQDGWDHPTASRTARTILPNRAARPA